MLVSDLKPVAVLNNLVVINHERMEGYDLASRHTDISVLKVLFSRLTETSLQCRQELIKEVYKLGAVPKVGLPASPDFSRAWNYVKEALDNKDPRAILNSCYYEEDVTLRTYEEALNVEDENITTQHQNLLSRQHELLLADHDKVKNLLNVLVND